MSDIIIFKTEAEMPELTMSLGTTLLISPQYKASSLSIMAPVKAISLVFFHPRIQGISMLIAIGAPALIGG